MPRGTVPTTSRGRRGEPVGPRVVQTVPPPSMGTSSGSPAGSSSVSSSIPRKAPTSGPKGRHLKKVRVDELDEDPILPMQKHVVISWVLPDDEKNDLKIPMMKVRGSYPDLDGCLRRAEYLQKTDPWVDITHAEVGKWFGLFPREELMKCDEVDVRYREDQLNDMMSDYKKNRREANINFETRRRAMIEKVKFDATKEGQEILSGQREEPIALLNRIQNYTAYLEELEQKIKETQDLLEAAKEKKEMQYQPEEFENIRKLEPGELPPEPPLPTLPEYNNRSHPGQHDDSAAFSYIPPSQSTLERIQARIRELEVDEEKEVNPN